MSSAKEIPLKRKRNSSTTNNNTAHLTRAQELERERIENEINHDVKRISAGKNKAHPIWDLKDENQSISTDTFLLVQQFAQQNMDKKGISNVVLTEPATDDTLVNSLRIFNFESAVLGKISTKTRVFIPVYLSEMEHWVSYLIFHDDKYVLILDSLPEPELDEQDYLSFAASHFEDYLSDHKINDYVADYAYLSVQDDDVQCGMWSLFFMWNFGVDQISSNDFFTRDWASLNLSHLRKLFIEGVEQLPAKK